jgi:hypothetical protein
MAVRSLNGTATNETSDQTTAQRDAFSQVANSQLGASRTVMNTLFDFGARGAADEIMVRAAEILSLNYGGISTHGFTVANDGVGTGKNPDFPGGHNSSAYRYHGMGNGKFVQINPESQAAHLTDKPNVFGPNIATLDIDTKAAKNNLTATSSTAKKENSLSMNNADVESNGFGTEINLNDPRLLDSDRMWDNLKPFFTLRDPNQREVLGEYIDTDTYDYEQ